MKEDVQRKPLKQTEKAESRKVLWTNKRRDHSRHMQDKDDKKLLEAQIGNLEVQISEYQQIVQELTSKLKQYENLYGSVFRKADLPENK